MIDLSVLQMLGLGAIFLGVLIGLAIWEHWFKKPKSQAVSVPSLFVPQYTQTTSTSVGLDETLAQAVLRRHLTTVDWPALADFAMHMPRMVSNDQVIDAYIAKSKAV